MLLTYLHTYLPTYEHTYSLTHSTCSMFVQLCVCAYLPVVRSARVQRRRDLIVVGFRRIVHLTSERWRPLGTMFVAYRFASRRRRAAGKEAETAADMIQGMVKPWWRRSLR